MSVFQNLLPLGGLVIWGFILGRRLRIEKETVANLLIYGVTPVVVLHGSATSAFSANNFAVPLILLVSACVLCGLMFFVSSFFVKSPARNILAFTAGNTNSGYFGLPATIAILGETYAPHAIFASFGFLIYENTLGYYITARGQYSVQQSLQRMSRLPAIYAFALGVSISYFQWTIPKILADFGPYFRGTYTVLGMMLVGMALAGARRFAFDFRFISLALVFKFAAWPAVIWIYSVIDRNYLHFVPTQLIPLLLLFSVLPLAANTVAFAAALDAEPEKAAAAVLISTFVGLGIISVFVGMTA